MVLGEDPRLNYQTAKIVISNVVKSDLDLVQKFLTKEKEFSNLERKPTSPSRCNRVREVVFKGKKRTECKSSSGLVGLGCLVYFLFSSVSYASLMLQDI